MKVKVAAAQFEPRLFRKEENMAALLGLAGEAASAAGPGGLVVLPEMATTGYVFRGREEIAPYVEPVPGPTTAVFGRLARERRVALVLGLPEVDPATGAYYNSAVLLGPDGKLAGVYRKTHSFHNDTRWAAEGDLGLPIFTGPWPGPLGLLVCMDAGFFETARVMALAGARILALAANWLRTSPSPEWRARAAENGVFLVAANRWGEERGVRFGGGSCVVGPRGEVLAEKDRGDCVVVAEIELDHGGSVSTGPEFGGLVRRRPDLYHDLVRHPYLWPERYLFGELGSGRFWLGAVRAGPGLGLPGGGYREREGLAFDLSPEACGGEVGRLLTLPPLSNRAGLEGVLRVAAERELYAGVAVPPGEEVVLVGPGGVVGRYSSPHRPAERAGDRAAVASAGPAGAAGTAFPVFDLPFARVGLAHPLDLLLPETPRILAKNGADVILASGSWPESLDDLAFLWAERAETNDLWLAVTTGRTAGVFAAGTGPGGSPDRGVAVGPPGLPGLLVEAGPGTVSRRKERVRRLRPELYLPLTSPAAG